MAAFSAEKAGCVFKRPELNQNKAAAKPVYCIRTGSVSNSGGTGT